MLTFKIFLDSVEKPQSSYTSIKSLISDENHDSLDEFPDDVDSITDDGEDNLICKLNCNDNNCRLCQARAAQDAVMGKNDESLAKKALRAKEAPHLQTRILITKLDDIAQMDDFHDSTILAKQIKEPVHGTV